MDLSLNLHAVVAQRLLGLYKKGLIDQQTALDYADSKTELNLKIRLAGAGG